MLRAPRCPAGQAGQEARQKVNLPNEHQAEDPAVPEIVNTRRFAASPADCFGVFRDPARLARWWGPAGFTNVVPAFDFRPGGRWRIVMRSPDGKEYPNASEFLEIVPEKFI